MATLVSDLADESRIEAGRLRLDFEAVDVRGIVDEVIRSETRMIEEKDLEIVINVPEELPFVWADHTRLVQILTNLLSNARKYTPEEGKILISAEACKNNWDPDGASKVIHFWVEDNGLGISPEDQEKIFQKFFRADDDKTREVPGTGLGLNITRSLVYAQGGVIWFTSEFRRGTVFHFTVPVSEQ
jgi:signal transduction histidine kinase